MKIVIDITSPSSESEIDFLKDFIIDNYAKGIENIYVFGKTTGHADLQDRSRHTAQEKVATLIREAGGDRLLNRSWSIFSTGCEGVASPIVVGLATRATVQASGREPSVGLVVGASRSVAIPDRERCTREHIEIAAECVRDAMLSADLAKDEVRLVLIKSPIRFSKEGPGGRHCFSTGASRGAAALGAAVALGEVALDTLDEDPILATSAHASRTMAFSGTENDHVEAIVFGLRQAGDPDWAITYAQTRDFLDVDAIRSMEQPPGFKPALIFYKAGIPADGRLRGRVTTVLNSELAPDKQLRAASSGLLAAIFGPMNTFISGGAEHQGPDGSCLCAILWQRG